MRVRCGGGVDVRLVIAGTLATIVAIYPKKIARFCRIEFGTRNWSDTVGSVENETPIEESDNGCRVAFQVRCSGGLQRADDSSCEDQICDGMEERHEQTTKN